MNIMNNWHFSSLECTHVCTFHFLPVPGLHEFQRIHDIACQMYHYFMPGFCNAWWSQSTRGPKHLFLRTLSPNLKAISLFLARAVCTFPLQVLHKRRSSKKHEHAMSFPFSHLSYLLYQCYSLVSKATTLMMISLFLGRWNVSILMQDSFKLTSTL